MLIIRTNLCLITFSLLLIIITASTTNITIDVPLSKNDQHHPRHHRK
jgi:hypothetical protein